MDPEYLNTSQSSSQALIQHLKWPENLATAFQNQLWPQFSNLQSAFCTVLKKGKKRILVECQFAQGKSSAYLLNLMNRLIHSPVEEISVTGKEFGQLSFLGEHILLFCYCELPLFDWG